MESSVFGLQPAKIAKSGTNIRIFFICLSSTVLRWESSDLTAAVKREKIKDFASLQVAGRIKAEALATRQG